MKIGLFGGTFDPIHWGHIRPVRHAMESLGLDRVIYLPTARPPHKPDQQFASASERFAMVELALLRQDGLFASAFELTPGRPAYTVDSVEHFQALHSEARIHLIIGADSYAELIGWKRWRDLVDTAGIVVLTREGWRTEDFERTLPRELADLAVGGSVDLVANPLEQISSTELREELARGESPPPGVVPELVLEYIHKYRLYR